MVPEPVGVGRAAPPPESPLDPSLLDIVLLAGVALVAGGVDAIAGGGGLLTLPVLLATGLPPHLALGTNKGQSVFGSGAALVRFARAGLVDRKRGLVSFPAGFAGSLLGAALVLLVRPEVLRPLVLVLLVAAALFVAFRRQGPPGNGPRGEPARPPGSDSHPKGPAPRAPLAGLARLRGFRAGPRTSEREDGPVAGAPILAGLLALGIGAYDGFFGPGTGTFLIVAFVAVLGDAMARASANAKVVNFASNLAAVILFASRGLVIWKLALPMAAAQLAGGWLGAQLAVRGGDRVVRRVVLAVVIALAAKLAADLVRG